ncbi:hypothetical protein Tco_0300207 [Tanacetum coccineum]
MLPKRTTTPMTDDAIKNLIAQGVADALDDYEAYRGNDNGNDSHDSRTSGRRQVPTTHECTYSDFLKCQPLNFKGTKGVVSLTQWLEKMEFIFHISNCTVANQVKFATCTLLELQSNVVELPSKEVCWGKSVAIAYTAGSGERKEYAGTLPLCNKCKFHYNGPCIVKWHYKSDCPELKDRNHGNQAEGTKAHGMVYALGRGETNQDLNNMEDDINA